MLIFLKLSAIAIASIGAALALLGDSRKDGRLTRVGKYSVAILVLGFSAAVALELVQFRVEREAELKSQKMARIAEEWRLTLLQPITTLKVSLLQRHELPIEEFEENMRRLRLALGTWLWRGHKGATTVELGIRSVVESPDAENRLRLVVLNQTPGRPSTGPAITLLRRALLDGESKRIDVAAEDIRILLGSDENNSDDSIEKPPDGHHTGTVVGATEILNGWPYSYSAEYDWTDSDATTCGVRASLAWSALSFSDEIATLGDLTKLAGVTVSVPATIDRHLLDRFDITLFTADGQVFSLDARHLNFEHGGSGFVADLSGYEWLRTVQSEFYEQGGRAPVRSTVR